MNLILFGMDASAFRDGSYLRKRLSDYARECDSLTAFVVTGDPAAKTFEQGNLKIAPIRSALKPIALFKFISAGRSAVRSLRVDGVQHADIVITSQDPFFLGLAAWIAARLSGARLHLQVHVEFFSPFYKKEGLKNRLQSAIARFLLPRADRIRPVSKRIGGYCEKNLGVPAEKIDVIPLLIDVERFKGVGSTAASATERKHFTKTVLMACRLEKQKNIPLALEALKKLPVGIGLLIVGKGQEEPRIRSRIAELGLGARVAIMPWSDDVPALMKGADAFLISSDYEGYVMTAMEASVCGLPVVMTDVGGAGEFVEDGVNGLVVPVGDANALARALGKILGDAALRQRLVLGAAHKSAGLPSYAGYVRTIVDSWRKTATR